MSERRWYQQSGTDGDVVISTRIRLARNLPDLPFPPLLSAEQKETVVRDLFAAFVDGEEQPFQKIRMADVTAARALSMVERHLISPEFSRCEAGTALLLSEDESISMMINEEDHLRIQVMRAGLDLDGAYQAANCWDDFLDKRFGFAFDERLGYLTQCPSNLGTGMRASVMLHLPALEEYGIVRRLASTVSKLGLTIRGLYGEGSQSQGALYQISNQVTLGITEAEAIENLKGIVCQIIKEERNYREQLKQTPAFEDKVFRSLGILQNARLLTGKEFMSLLSYVRMGVSLHTVDGMDLGDLDALMTEVQPATLCETGNKEWEPAERDYHRAARVREALQHAH